MQRLLCAAIGSLALLSGACGPPPPASSAGASSSGEAGPAPATPPPAEAPAAQPSPSPDSAAPPEPPAAAGKQPAPPKAAAAAQAPAKPAGPQPLTPAEQQEAESKCRPLMQALGKAKGKGGGSPLDAFHELLKNPPKMPKADLDRCTDLMERGLVSYLIAAKEVEARMMMTRFGKAMAMAYSQHGKLCPSSEHPIPRDRALIETEPYTSTAEDWNTPAWKCLEVEMPGLQQRFQYEVRSDPQAKTFEVIARGAPGGKGQWVELRQKGVVKAQGIEMGPVERR